MPTDSKLAHVSWEMRGDVAVLQLDRREKHNAIDDTLLASLASFFQDPPAGTRAIVLHGAGDNFCSGLDLSEHKARTPFEVTRHSQTWHRAFEIIQFGGIPVVACLRGAVIGGGLELAMATHVRVSEPSTFYALPEGQRGIFVGGGASVRVARVIGTGRMADMMLTGRRYDAEEGYRLGFAHYMAPSGGGLDKALELATRIAENAPLSNYAIVTALARIENMSMSDGLFTESLVAGLVQSHEEAGKRMAAFLERKKNGGPGGAAG